MAIENLEQLEQSVGLEKGKLSEMINSEETFNLELDNFVISKKDDYNSLIDNHKKTARVEGEEIAIKNARTKLGLDFQGKTMDNLLNSFKEQIVSEAKIEPNKKYDNLHKDFEALQSVSKSWEEKYTGLEQTYKQKENQLKIDTSILKSIPDNVSIPKEDILAIAKARIGFNIGEDGIEIVKDGVVQKNQANMNLLTISEFMPEFITPYLKTPEGGSGGGDSSNKGGESSLELFDKKMEAKGIAIESEDYNIEMSLALKNGTLKF